MMSGWLWLLIGVVVIVVVVGVVVWMRSGTATDTGADDPADDPAGPSTGDLAEADAPVPAGPVAAPSPDAERPGSLFETPPAGDPDTSGRPSPDDPPGDSERDETPATAEDAAAPATGATTVTESGEHGPGARDAEDADRAPVRDDPPAPTAAGNPETSADASTAAPVTEPAVTEPAVTDPAVTDPTAEPGAADAPGDHPAPGPDRQARPGEVDDRNVTPNAESAESGSGSGAESADSAVDSAAESGADTVDPAGPAAPDVPADVGPERAVAGPDTTWTDVEPAAAGPADATDADATGADAAERPLPVSGSALASLDAVLIVPASGEPVPGPHPGSVQAPPDGSAPPDSHRIKAHSGSRRYHTLDSPYYIRTRADIYFVGVEEAEAAGFVAWNSRPGGTPRRF